MKVFIVNGVHKRILIGNDEDGEEVDVVVGYLDVEVVVQVVKDKFLQILGLKVLLNLLHFG